MPWKTSGVVTERAKFVLEWERRWNESQGRRVDMAELCRMFGISRPTGYLWVRRYQEAGRDVRALADRSHRPHRIPHAVPEAMQDFIVAARKSHPRWGPRTLRSWLVERYPGREFPSAATFAAILKRHGMTTPRRHRHRRRVPLLAEPLGEATAPNSIWCIDFKGQFRTSDGVLCYPVTLLDAFSRYCLRCEAFPEPSGEAVRRTLDSAFREFGLPATIRSDNGAPFAANGPQGLSAVSVWLLRLGIRLERIGAGKPQQNGRLERFHRTLKEGTAAPPAASLRLQQRAFNHFRREYNTERPHHALGMKTPASRYVPSRRRYPCGLLAAPTTVGWAQTLTVGADGAFRWSGRRIFVSSALAFERVTVMPAGDTRWVVAFGAIELGSFDDRRLEHGLTVRPRSRKPHHLQL